MRAWGIDLYQIYSYCGAMEKGLSVVDQALEVAEAKQPAWKAFPQAARIRMHLLQGDTHSARQAAGDGLLEPITIPYARYTIFLSLANIELAVSKGEHEFALALAEDLHWLKLCRSRMWISLMYYAGRELLCVGLGRINEAHAVLTPARSFAEESGCDLHLWPILANLADVNSDLGHHKKSAAGRSEARSIVERIAESLREVGLHETFLSQPRIRLLMRG